MNWIDIKPHVFKLRFGTLAIYFFFFLNKEILLRENMEISIFSIKFDLTVNHLATEGKILKKEKKI